MKIEIHSNAVEEQSGISKRTGQPYSIRKQQAWVSLPGQPYPRMIKIPLGRDQVPYEPGNYLLDRTSFEVNRYDELGIRPSLKKAG